MHAPTEMRTVKLPSGEAIPVLGLGTWRMGEDVRSRSDEVASLRLGLDLGMTLIDTAEMYGDGGAEDVVRVAIAGRRDEVFLVSKVLPSHATAAGTVRACEKSLKRLGTDRLDLYLLHWRERIPLEETLEGFARLLETGKIRYLGVSNFDASDMDELVGLAGGAAVATNQVLYGVRRRGIEFDLLPWCERHSVPVMAYSPIEQGLLLHDRALRRIAASHGASPAQVALAWAIRRPGVLTIPKAVGRAHVEENRAALDLRLTAADLSMIDEAHPPPRRKVPLELL
jgi:diketogulonate reductase-like aldo/keto reductase